MYDEPGWQKEKSDKKPGLSCKCGQKFADEESIKEHFRQTRLDRAIQASEQPHYRMNEDGSDPNE